ncbi:hypothetical protein L593_08120 [Salinarchaeum sp. Harcht-Bsk1]|nr:hypothetical protein L593_08120 [Salinarchaeum sp. Harcht-Bsk1]
MRSLGLALIVLGAAVLVAPTLGFDSIDAERRVSADAAANPNAQLGLQQAYDGTQIQYVDGIFGDTVVNATVANVTNRVGNPLTVDARVASIDWSGGSDAVLEVSNDGDFSGQLATNGTVPIRLGCSQQVSGTATDATVGITVDGSGDPVSVQGATIAVQNVAFNCDGAGAGDGDPPDDPIPITDPRIDLQVVGQPAATQGFFGANSVVTYDLENTGDDPVAVTGIHIADASAGSRVRRGGDELTIPASSTGNLDQTDGLSIGANAPQYDLDQNATIAGGQTAGVELGQFRAGSYFWQQVDMRGESVTVVLMVEGLNVSGREDPVPVEMTLSVQ